MAVKVLLEFTHNDAVRTEVVDVASPRFLEILNEDGSAKVQQADQTADLGVGTITRKLNYTDADGSKKTASVKYHMDDGQVVFDEFEPFKLRDFDVTASHTSHGDMLQVDLGAQNFTFTDVASVNDMVNAIRRTYKFNSLLLGDVVDPDDEDDSNGGADTELSDEQLEELTKPTPGETFVRRAR